MKTSSSMMASTIRTEAPATSHLAVPMPANMKYFLGGTSVLIVVGVALDLVDKLAAQLVMRNYEGYMKESGPGWTKKKEEDA